MFNLDASEDQLDFPTIYGSAKLGWMNDIIKINDNIFPLLDAANVSSSKIDSRTTQLLITSLDFSNFIGR